MATATIALVSESLAAGGGRQLVGGSRRLGQGAEGPLGAQRLDGASYGLSCGPRHAGRRRSGSARLRPWLWLGCSFRLEDSSFRLLGGVGRLRAAQLDPRGAVLSLLMLGDSCLGVRWRLGALAPAPDLRHYAPCWGRGRGGPTGICSTPWCTEKRVSHSVTT